MAGKHRSLGMTVLGSGSRGNALVLHADDFAVLVDAGFSDRELARRMQAAGVECGSVRAVVISHEHSDHVKGLRAFASKRGLAIYANRATAEVLRHRDSRIGPMTIFASGNPFSVGPFQIHPFSIPHDAIDPVGFLVQVDAYRIGIATDLGHASHLVTYQLRGCDALVLESNHDVTMLGNSTRPWSLKQRILSRHGHLSNAAAMDLLRATVDGRTRHVVIAHASEECNCYELLSRTVEDCLGALGRTDISVHIARQDNPLPTVWLP
ncbi:MAG: MBL fold metallo-hydrolase [Lentisphaeria bacterium]|nr:MBL fold metallo-hydrolase [Lentisphaeria bacterium]